MKDLAIRLTNKPVALADMGEILGKASISLEGSGVFVYNGEGIAHFMVEGAYHIVINQRQDRANKPKKIYRYIKI